MLNRTLLHMQLKDLQVYFQYTHSFRFFLILKNTIHLKCGKSGSEKDQFANLELLDLSNTSITVLDLQILSELNTLDVSGSSIETMHVEGAKSMNTVNLIIVKGEELKLEGWPGLQEINLSFSSWDKIELKNCTDLKRLHLSNVTLTPSQSVNVYVRQV